MSGKYLTDWERDWRALHGDLAQLIVDDRDLQGHSAMLALYDWNHTVKSSPL